MFAQACGSHTERVFPTIALSRYVWRLAGSGCYLALFSVLAVLSGGGGVVVTMGLRCGRLSVLIPMNLETQGVFVMRVLLAVALT